MSNLPKEASVPVNPDTHELRDFVASSQRRMQEAYDGIQKRAKEDPGSAGDQGEENWATLLREWLPPYFQIVTRGRILFPCGYASGQVDVLVLMPAYPKGLLSQKLYIASGVAAVFECKTTLKAEYIRRAVEVCSEIQRAVPQTFGSPYREMTSPIIVGLLAHSHVWKDEHSKPQENIEKALFDADLEFARHPRETMDILCVADLGTWSVARMSYVPRKRFPSEEMATTGFMRAGLATSPMKDNPLPLQRKQAVLTNRMGGGSEDGKQPTWEPVNSLGKIKPAQSG